jgi:hypothetical protein
MRLWTLHPEYLDAKGLVALWREGLLALRVLQGRTKGYRHHPQLERFRTHADPVAAINRYLAFVYDESVRRGYSFDGGKIDRRARSAKIRVTRGQLLFELSHLRKKLKIRDPERFRALAEVKEPKPHPIFRVAEGAVEPWEKIS